MASPGQRKGACGHIMASFDRHSRCARCRDKGLGEDPCVLKLPCEYCEVLTPEQVIQLATPTYKLRKEKVKSKDTLVDPSTVTVEAQVESQDSEPAFYCEKYTYHFLTIAICWCHPTHWPTLRNVLSYLKKPVSECGLGSPPMVM